MNFADDFVKFNLGLILHNDSNYYEKPYTLKGSVAQKKGLIRDPYFMESPEATLINQARMSTGENLLVSVLYSLKILYSKPTVDNDGRPCIVFLDEIQLALHSSALRRLILFLKSIVESLNLAIFFQLILLNR